MFIILIEHTYGLFCRSCYTIYFPSGTLAIFWIVSFFFTSINIIERIYTDFISYKPFEEQPACVILV